MLLLLLACDKERQTSRKIKGQWEMVHVKMTLPDGLSEYGSGTGTWIIEDSEEENYQCSMQRSTAVSFPSAYYQESVTGYMTFKNKGKNIDVFLTDTNNSILFQEEHRILILTKTDLQVEYRNSNNVYITQTFRRKN